MLWEKLAVTANWTQCPRLCCQHVTELLNYLISFLCVLLSHSHSSYSGCVIKLHFFTLTTYHVKLGLKKHCVIITFRNRGAIAPHHDSSSQCICTQEDTGAELNIEEQHWISTGIFPDVSPGNSYVHCHCRETSNTARRHHDVNSYLWIVINKENSVAINTHTILQVTELVNRPLF